MRVGRETRREVGADEVSETERREKGDCKIDLPLYITL